MTTDATDDLVRVRGANEHNLRNVDVDIPRNVMVAFTGISGSGKSSLAFGTLYAEAQRRYFESVAPYARRLLQQVGAPHVQEITGLPPAVALQQRRGAATSRLGHRPRPGGRRRRRSGRRDRDAGRHRAGRRERDRAVPGTAARADMSWLRPPLGTSSRMTT